jgi:hypothetical protein
MSAASELTVSLLDPTFVLEIDCDIFSGAAYDAVRDEIAAPCRNQK